MDYSKTISIVFSGFQACDITWNWIRSKRSLRYYDLWFVAKGKGYIQGPYGTTVLEQGDCALFPPGLELSATQEIKNRLSVYFIHFQLDPVPSWMRVESDRFLKVSIRDAGLLEGLALRSVKAHQESYWGSPDSSAIWLSSTMEEMRSNLSAQQLKQRDPLTWKFDQLCDRIRSDPTQKWSLERMAEACSISPSYLTKVFRKRTGCSPYEFVIRTRLNEAKSMLDLSNENIAQISDKLGYADPFTFSKQFRKHVGLSPLQWRQQ